MPFVLLVVTALQGAVLPTAVAASGQSQRLLEAEVELQNLRRKLDEDLHEVRHQMHINDSNLADSRELLSKIAAF